MSRLRIVVGPEAMFVERDGVRSEKVPLTATDGPKDVREKAAHLWQTIRRIVSFRIWARHRVNMAFQRSLAALLTAMNFALWFPSPRPDLIAVKPWKSAAFGEWTSVPHGVAARVLRSVRA